MSTDGSIRPPNRFQQFSMALIYTRQTKQNWLAVNGYSETHLNRVLKGSRTGSRVMNEKIARLLRTVPGNYFSGL